MLLHFEHANLFAPARQGPTPGPDMQRPPFITGDGQAVDLSDVHFNTELGAPQVSATMVFSHTTDALRGLVRDVSRRALEDGRHLASYMDISGRSGHSRIGIDVELLDEPPAISDEKRSIEFKVLLTALNPMLSECLSELADMARAGTVDIGRLFIPMSPPLDRGEVLAAMGANHLKLPENHRINPDGSIELPLDDVAYVLSPRLLSVNRNFSELIKRGKHGLSLIQQPSPAGLPETIGAKSFFVGAVRISLGPFTAFIDRALNRDGVFHLASRLLDGLRTSGIDHPRQVELYNMGDEPVSASDLAVRIRLYPGEDRVARIASRVLVPEKAAEIIDRGVDFSEITNIFDHETCDSLFDEVSTSCRGGGSYGRLLMPGRLVNIPWEQEGEDWMPEFQWRLVYEAARGYVEEGSLTGNEIPRRFRAFMDDLTYVGGEQKLSKVFVADFIPPVDTLRVLKRNGVGVVVVRSINPRNGGMPDLYLDQAMYEELVRLDGEGMRFYLPFENGDSSHVREFHHGFWVTRKGRERFDRIHTAVAMFGSSVPGLREFLSGELLEFFSGLRDEPRLGDGLAIAHGSGPGVMKIVDDAARELGIFRIGVGMDAEKLDQAPNMSPEALVQFVNLALNTRQDILDRRSLFKVFNLGGYGTCYEINMALTFMKIGHCLPAPYIFVDPFGVGPEGSHLWAQSIGQFRTIAAPGAIGGKDIEPFGPQWIANCCHLVKSYAEGFEVISGFLDDPGGYWRRAGVDLSSVVRARDNLKKAGVPIAPFIEEALARG